MVTNIREAAFPLLATARRLAGEIESDINKRNIDSLTLANVKALKDAIKRLMKKEKRA